MDEEKYNTIIAYLENILEKIENIESRLNKIEGKKPVKLKYTLLQQWKENIRNNCPYLEVVGIEEEAEYFCSKIKDVCNIFNCPLNKVEENDSKN